MYSNNLLLLLQAIKETNQGPLQTARSLYLWGMICYDALQYRSSSMKVIDTQYLPNGKSTNFPSAFEKERWLNNCSLWAAIQLSRELNYHAYDNKYELTFLSSEVPIFEKWRTRMIKYINDRKLDGSQNNEQPPFMNDIEPIYKSGKLPDDQIQDISSWPTDQQYKWHPIQITDTKQTYLGAEWGMVRCLLNDQQLAYCKDKAESFYPTEQDMEKEIDQIIDIYQNLNDEQRIIAEIWAGGSGSVTPPGIMAVISLIFIRANNFDTIKQLTFWLKLGTALFEASIAAWGLKRQHLQARPIQLIRKRKDQVVKNGSGIEGPAWQWLPYQELDFITPPFPDFVSGHSTFSSSASIIFNEHFGTNNIKLNGKNDDVSLLNLISPIFDKMDGTFNLNCLIIPPNISKIREGYPLAGLTLNFNNITEVADQCGMSRLYGGIHIMSSNVSALYCGQQIGYKVCELINNYI